MVKLEGSRQQRFRDEGEIRVNIFSSIENAVCKESFHER